MIEYRAFQNSDPPGIVRLWEICGLGRGAATGISCDAFESAVFSRSTFERQGLIVATADSEIIGYAHGGFGPNADETGLSYETGVICAVMVHPEFRGRGIGTELARRVEAYLSDHGAGRILAGPAPPFDPFYVGLYGGVQPAGFLLSDADAGPFFRALGYRPAARHFVFQKEITAGGEPVNFRLMSVRRKTELVISNLPPGMTWWWLTRYGDADSVSFLLQQKSGGPAVAGVTAVGLDFYLTKWRERAVGLIDLSVPEPERRHGYAQALVLNTCRRLRDELVSRVEIHAPEANEAAVALVQSCGFEQVDTGVVYERQG